MRPTVFEAPLRTLEAEAATTRAALTLPCPLRAAGDKTAPSAGGAVRRTRVDRRGLRRGKVSRAGDPQQAALVYCDAASRLGAGAAWATGYSRTGGWWHGWTKVRPARTVRPVGFALARGECFVVRAAPGKKWELCLFVERPWQMGKKEIVFIYLLQHAR